MRLYPDIPARRTATLLRDGLTLLLVILFAALGLRVHHDVDRLAVLGQGVASAGDAVQSGFGRAADAVGGTPLIGGRIADGLRGAGSGSGGELAGLGHQGIDDVHRLATLLGLLTFVLPTVLVLSRVLPARLEQVRSLTAAERVLAPDRRIEHRREVAMRAALHLPYGRLLAYTTDPLGDLAAGRYDRLIDAALEDAGLRAPRRAR
jgi:hypothetical protein